MPRSYPKCTYFEVKEKPPPEEKIKFKLPKKGVNSQGRLWKLKVKKIEVYLNRNHEEEILVWIKADRLLVLTQNRSFYSLTEDLKKQTKGNITLNSIRSISNTEICFTARRSDD